ncbi:MAG TPA: hypothetical protein VEU31_09730 [Candidatus Acidoferrales bacterium]|nr:hypothetical protein [Candidatus Acidoferrales bacterium]
MAESKRLRAKTIIAMVLMISFGSVGNLLLGKGMQDLGEVRFGSLQSLGTAFLHVATSGTIWLGILLLLSFFVCYLLVLSWADYSYVLPGSAIGLAAVTLLAYAVLHEKVAPTRWAGVAVICAGVYLVGKTSPRTTEAE